MDDDTFQRELYARMSTAERAADTIWIIHGALDGLKERLNLGHTAEHGFYKCLEAMSELAERLKYRGVSDLAQKFSFTHITHQRPGASSFRD